MDMSRHVIEASKRPTSMAVPLPSWSASRYDRGFTASSKSIAVRFCSNNVFCHVGWEMELHIIQGFKIATYKPIPLAIIRYVVTVRETSRDGL